MPTEETLDPSDWGMLRVVGHRMLDDMLDYLLNIRNLPAWRPLPEVLVAKFSQPLPGSPQTLDSVYREFREDILSYPSGNLHPRFWAWVDGTGTPLSMLASMLAAGMNPNVEKIDNAASLVELQVISWMKSIMMFPLSGGGILLSGTSMANLISLATARTVKSQYPVRQVGMRQAPRMKVYASKETHISVKKSIELLGLGSRSLQLISTTADHKIDIKKLVAAIAADIKRGCQPICIVGNAGTTNTGAIDDLDSIADICYKEDLWFHIDGAFGALAMLSVKLRSLLSGLERADSLAFDLHKWGYLPYGTACALFRDLSSAQSTFSSHQAYLQSPTPGKLNDIDSFFDLGIELSREFRALKVWMTLKVHGAELLGRLIEQNVSQANYLGNLIEEHPNLELLAPVSLNVVCFRYVKNKPQNVSAVCLNKMNQKILSQLALSGVAMLSGTYVGQAFALRAAITNHRSRTSDFQLLIKEIVDLGRAAAS